MRTHVILAVLKRNLMSYFTRLLGYLLIVAFVGLASVSLFNAQFFTNNLANLDQLTEQFPYLLLFIIPAITMTAWADEKRQGTDELLFTLPASDFEIILGKYLSLVLVYSVALSFSLTMLPVLGYYADPDWGLLLTTYFGYWLSGATLISLAMFASALTRSVTVAFVLGAVFCSLPVFVGHLAESRPYIENPSLGQQMSDGFMTLATRLSIPERLSEFSLGIVPFSGIVYFLSLIAFALYLNAIVISRRHWVDPSEMKSHFFVRVASLVIILICGNIVITAASESMSMQIDATAENLYSLSDTTEELVDNLDKENPVTIQAFISPNVPRELVNHQTRLKGLLRQYDRASTLIDVRMVDTTPFSLAAEEAEHFGIQAQPQQTEENGRFRLEDVFMGVVVSSQFDEVVIPFFESASLIEYELTRSIRTVSQEERQKIGILRTDAQLNGGFDMQRMQSIPGWQIVGELEKQYDIEEVSPESLNTLGDDEKVDVLLVAMPSSLTQVQMENLLTYMKDGNPVLLLDDPFPNVNPQNAPSQPKRNPNQGMMGMMGGGQPPPEPRADNGTASSLVDLLDIRWDNKEMVWDDSNPHPQLDVPPDVFFIREAHDNLLTINPDSDVTRGLQELVVIFPGRIQRERKSDGLKWDALLWSGPRSGTVTFDDHFPNGFMGPQNDPTRMVRDRDDRKEKILATHVHGKKGDDEINAIYVADLDMISNQIFRISQTEAMGLRLDNVRFILNCVDVLAGESSYVSLRNRRAKHRILTRVQEQIDEFRAEVTEQRAAAEEEAEKETDAAQDEFEKDLEKINENRDQSLGEKLRDLAIAQQQRQKQLDTKLEAIEAEKERELEKLEAASKREQQALENQFRLLGVLLPPIPSLLLGLIVLVMRLSAEQRTVEEGRRRKG